MKYPLSIEDELEKRLRRLAINSEFAPYHSSTLGLMSSLYGLDAPKYALAREKALDSSPFREQSKIYQIPGTDGAQMGNLPKGMSFSYTTKSTYGPGDGASLVYGVPSAYNSSYAGKGVSYGGLGKGSEGGVSSSSSSNSGASSSSSSSGGSSGGK